MAIIGGIPHFQTYPDGGINSKCRIQPLRAPNVDPGIRFWGSSCRAALLCSSTASHSWHLKARRRGWEFPKVGDREKNRFLCESGWCIIVSSIGIIWFWWIFHHLDVTSQRNRSVELGDQRCKATKQTTSRALLHNLTCKWYVYIYI